MLNKKNKGMSIVEIVIAIAVFVILMIPIVTSIISSMKSATRGKGLQYRNDFAQDLVEYIKQGSLSSEDILSDSYYKQIGADEISFSSEQGEETTIDGTEEKKAAYESYYVNGSVRLGIENKKFSYKVKISNQDYAKKEISDSAYVNPNNLKVGVVEDLDHTKLALINGTVANYDITASKAFLSEKLSILSQKAPEKYNQYMLNTSTSTLFNDDTATRIVLVKVEKIAGKYNVSCTLRYKDNSRIEYIGGNMSDDLNDHWIEYVPYSKQFDELPNIYLMYNPCIYNGVYSDNDYIVLDTDGIDDTEVNLFVVETAEKYSDNAKLAIDGMEDNDKKNYSMKDTTLYPRKLSGKERSEVLVHILSSSTTKQENVNIYHNIDGKNTLKTDQGYESYVALDNNKVHIDTLDKAEQETRGLYTIDVWMKEGDLSDIDIANDDPILEATKGGNEN